MREYWSLTLVLLTDIGTAFEVRSGKTNRKWAGIALWSVVGISLLPLITMLYMLFQGMYVIFAAAGQLGYITGVVLNTVSMIVFIFSAFSAPAIFYFSKEVEFLLPLPLKPIQIIAAKFTVALFFEYLVTLFVLLPLYLAFLSHLPAGVLTVNILVTFLLLPIAPLAYAITLVMLLMRVSRFGRRRDMFNMLVGLVSVIIGVGISVFSQRLSGITAEQVEALFTGNQAALTALRSIFPGNIFAGDAIAGGSVIYQLINIGIVILTLCVFFLLADRLYFKGVIGISESSRPSKKMSRDEIVNESRGLSALASYLQKELRLLFRSPTAFINCVVTVFLVPLLIAGMAFLNLGEAGTDLTELMGAADFSDPRINALVLTGAAAAGFLISAMGLVTSTAISREGPNYFVMKFIPVDYRTQLTAKFLSGAAVSFMGLILILAMGQAVFHMPIMLFAGVCILTLPGIVILNALGLLVDLMKPKLQWDNEQQAVKQNVNVILQMFAGIILAVAVGAVGVIFFKTPGVAFTALLLITSALAGGTYYIMIKLGGRLLENLNG